MMHSDTGVNNLDEPILSLLDAMERGSNQIELPKYMLSQSG